VSIFLFGDNLVVADFKVRLVSQNQKYEITNPK
jgi:hypothetical protein